MPTVLGQGRLRGVGVRLLFEPRDCWTGVFWRRDVWHHGPHYPAGRGDGRAGLWAYWALYVCLVPCLPVQLSWRRRMQGREEA